MTSSKNHAEAMMTSTAAESACISFGFVALTSLKVELIEDDVTPWSS
jgi:hypothetical protein